MPTRNVIAKFKCTDVREASGGYPAHRIVTLEAAHGPGNEQWSTHTPGGSLTMTITNPDAFEQFEEGAEYTLTFDRVEA